DDDSRHGRLQSSEEDFVRSLLSLVTRGRKCPAESWHTLGTPSSERASAGDALGGRSPAERTKKSAGRAVSRVAWHDDPRTGVEARLARLVLVVPPHPQPLRGRLLATLSRPVQPGAAP